MKNGELIEALRRKAGFVTSAYGLQSVEALLLEAAARLEDAGRDTGRMDWLEQSGNAELSLYNERGGWTFHEGPMLRGAIDAASQHTQHR